MSDLKQPWIATWADGETNNALGLIGKVLVGPEKTDGAFSLWEEEVRPGEGPPLHIHHRETEVFTVLSGQLRFVCGDLDVVAEFGTAVLIPPGQPHTFRNVGRDVARATILLSPGAGLQFFRDAAAEKLDARRDQARVTELATKYGMEFVGPPLD